MGDGDRPAYQKWEVKRIPIDKIVVPEKRLRAYRDEKEQHSLEATAQKFGIINEIGVKPLPDGRFELIYGEGRLRTLQKLGAKEVDAKVWYVSDDMAIELQLMENYARGRIDPKEFFMVIDELFTKYGKTPEEIADLTGYSVERIKQLLKIRDLDEQTKLAFLEGEINMAQVEELMRIKDETKRLEVLDMVLRTRMSAQDIRNYRKHVIEGICDRCGLPKPPLVYVNGMWLCHDCLVEVQQEFMKEAARLEKGFTCEFCRQQFQEHEIMWVGICNKDYELLKAVKEYVGLSLGKDPLYVYKEDFMQFIKWLRGEK